MRRATISGYGRGIVPSPKTSPGRTRIALTAEKDRRAAGRWAMGDSFRLAVTACSDMSKGGTAVNPAELTTCRPGTDGLLVWPPSSVTHNLHRACFWIRPTIAIELAGRDRPG
jgi:hypothetical protein